MSLGNASIKRATGAIGKTGEKSKKAAFTANRSLIELEISKSSSKGLRATSPN